MDQQETNPSQPTDKSPDKSSPRKALIAVLIVLVIISILLILMTVFPDLFTAKTLGSIAPFDTINKISGFFGDYVFVLAIAGIVYYLKDNSGGQPDKKLLLFRANRAASLTLAIVSFGLFIESIFSQLDCSTSACANISFVTIISLITSVVFAVLFIVFMKLVSVRQNQVKEQGSRESRSEDPPTGDAGIQQQ